VLVGRVDRVTVSWVDVAADTVPTAPLLKTTVLLPAVASKLVPVIVTEVALMARFAVFNVTVGAGGADTEIFGELYLSTVAVPIRRIVTVIFVPTDKALPESCRILASLTL